jgi:hypothetical protein
MTTIDPRTIELIHADIDGEISAAEKRELDELLATTVDARAFHAEMASLCATLDAAETLEPPPHLKHVVLQMLKPKRRTVRSPGRIARLFAEPALRVATAFAAGIILTLSFISSDRMSRNAFDDLTSLVGTIADSPGNLPVRDSVSISRHDIAGTVTLRKSGRILVVDFDLVSNGPVDIVAQFRDRSIWFNGFAQLESSGTSIAAGPGQVTLSMDGKRRYAVYLHDNGSKDASVDLKFVASGNIIHEAQLAIR